MNIKYGKKETEYLKEVDPVLGAYIHNIKEIKRGGNPNLFAALTSIIIGQQISIAAAESIHNRLKTSLGQINPISINNANESLLEEAGLTERKRQYIKDLAFKLVHKEIDLETIKNKSDKETIEILSSIKGIGKWSAQMLMIFSLHRPNVISYDDLAIRRGMMLIYNLKSLSYARFLKISKVYSPYASIASLYIWEAASPKFMGLEDFAIYDLPFGKLKIVYEGLEVLKLSKVIPSIKTEGKRNAFTDGVASKIKEYVKGNIKELDINIRIKGTDLQKQVWDVIKGLKYGKTFTYKDIAMMINKPNSSSLISSICEDNDFPIIIPTHRIIKADGTLGEYIWGKPLKRKLIMIEAKNK